MDRADGFDKLSQRVRSLYTVLEIYMFSRRSNTSTGHLKIVVLLERHHYICEARVISMILLSATYVIVSYRVILFSFQVISAIRCTAF
jgi:hypothetical protein